MKVVHCLKGRSHLCVHWVGRDLREICASPLGGENLLQSPCVSDEQERFHRWVSRGVQEGNPASVNTVKIGLEFTGVTLLTAVLSCVSRATQGAFLCKRRSYTLTF